MKIENCKLSSKGGSASGGKISKKAFTLIELLVAIAIIGILAAVVLVQFSSYAKKARASRAMAQASSVISQMVSCAGNYSNADVNFSGQICDSSANYGSWPSFPSGYDVNASNWTSSSNWYFRISVESGMNTICCNSKMSSCGQPTTCSAAATW